MAYKLRNEKGIPIKRNGNDVLVSDSINVKLSELNETDMSFLAVASDESEDRDSDVIRQLGWKLANYKKNPIVAWAHDYRAMPVGVSKKTWVDKDNLRLMFKPKFDSADDKSMEVFNKYKNGFLKTFSVGFAPIKYKVRDENLGWWGGLEHEEQELLEISCVPVPANPNASVQFGMGGNELKSMIQMGYPERFRKIENGLFYPVMDIALFSEPEFKEVMDGIKAVYAKSIDDCVDCGVSPVAYVFDETKFDGKQANEWVKANANFKWKTKYFDLKVNDDGFELDEMEVENAVLSFDIEEDKVAVSTVDDKASGDDFVSGDDGSSVAGKEEKSNQDGIGILKFSLQLVKQDETVIDEKKGFYVVDLKTVDTVEKYLESVKQLHIGEAIGKVSEGVYEKLLEIVTDLKDTVKGLNGIDKKNEVSDDSNGEDDDIEFDSSLFESPGGSEEKDVIEIDGDSMEETFKEAFGSGLKTGLENIVADLFNGNGKID